MLMKRDKSSEAFENAVFINLLTDFGFKRIFMDGDLMTANFAFDE
jgi:hypothetical protein